MISWPLGSIEGSLSWKCQEHRNGLADCLGKEIIFHKDLVLETLQLLWNFYMPHFGGFKPPIWNIWMPIGRSFPQSIPIEELNHLSYHVVIRNWADQKAHADGLYFWIAAERKIWEQAPRVCSFSISSEIESLFQKKLNPLLMVNILFFIKPAVVKNTMLFILMPEAKSKDTSSYKNRYLWVFYVSKYWLFQEKRKWRCQIAHSKQSRKPWLKVGQQTYVQPQTQKSE